jgi:uncharacterized protein (DUF433 family)
VARYLRLPLLAIDGPAERFEWFPDPEWILFHFHRFYHSLLPFDDTAGPPIGSEPVNVTFLRLAELFVLAAGFDVLREVTRTVGADRQDWWNRVRPIGKWMRVAWTEPDFEKGISSRTRVSRLLDRKARVGEYQVLLKKYLARRLERVEMAGSVPARVFPFSRSPADDSPRTIVLDPAIRFGRPTIVNRGLPTDIVFERFQAGEGVLDIGDDYGVPVGEIEEALRYEAIPQVAIYPPYFGW